MITKKKHPIRVLFFRDHEKRGVNAAGGAPDGLASLTIYITDVEDYQAHGKEIGAVWRRLAGTEYPAMAGVGVSRLWLSEALVEIQGIAVVSRA